VAGGTPAVPEYKLAFPRTDCTTENGPELFGVTIRFAVEVTGGFVLVIGDNDVDDVVDDMFNKYILYNNIILS
jgi:hypothetical protein